MGIRFYCPNGHKLNVKAFLAGKRGICPHCGAKVQIPTESTLEPGSKSDRAGAKGAAKSVHAPATEASADGKATASSPVEEAGSLDAGTDVGAGADDTDSGSSGPPALPRAKPLPNDPLDEAQDAAWYVRATDGGQYGPANADVMHQWLREGRIGGDCLVWREGWKDWQNAADIFSSLMGNPDPRVEIGRKTVARSDSGVSRGNALSSRGRKNMVRGVVITILVVVVIVGSAGLAWVVLR